MPGETPHPPFDVWSMVKRVAMRFLEFDAKRRALIGGLHGRMLEIGAGSGRNLADLAVDVDYHAVEPDTRARRQLLRRAATLGRVSSVLPGRAETLPYPAASFDAAFATFVFCSVDDPEAVFAELQRVVRPGGRILLVEHVAAPEGRRLHKVQSLLSPLSARLNKGCRWDRDPLAAAARAGLHVDAVEECSVRVGIPGLLVPCVIAEATVRR